MEEPRRTSGLADAWVHGVQLLSPVPSPSTVPAQTILGEALAQAAGLLSAAYDSVIEFVLDLIDFLFEELDFS